VLSLAGVFDLVSFACPGGNCNIQYLSLSRGMLSVEKCAIWFEGENRL